MGGFTSSFSKDWENYFVDLKKTGTNNFYQILGPFIVGIRLSEIGSLNSYRPSLVIIGLWEDLKQNIGSFSRQGFMFEDFGYSIGVRQLSVKNENHADEWSRVAKIVDKEKKISFGRDVSVGEFLDCFDFWTNIEDPKKERHSFHAKVLTYKLKLAVYLDDIDFQERILGQILQEKEGWDLEVFELGFGPFETWFNALKKISVQDVRNKIETNKRNKNFSKLQNFKMLL
ncbi:hypothetical protein [Flagellimonas lutimaris]|uniref:hypothetical protein n=1 Tax=Flagellimonas lutimaris TaxID=475082 RepID=UPI003F5CD480